MRGAGGGLSNVPSWFIYWAHPAGLAHSTRCARRARSPAAAAPGTALLPARCPHVCRMYCSGRVERDSRDKVYRTLVTRPEGLVQRSGLSQVAAKVYDRWI